MKTTLELPDDLLIEANAAAEGRRTTLEALIEQALRREIQPTPAAPGEAEGFIETSPAGFPRLKRQGAAFITSAMIRQMLEDEGI